MIEPPTINEDIELDARKVSVFDYITPEHVKELVEEIGWHKSNGSLEDGVKSVSSKNREAVAVLKVSKQAPLLHGMETFWSRVKSADWIHFVGQKSNTEPMFSVTSEGGYYRAHFDAPQNGHFSNTLFLSDPDEYEGGELEILIDGEIKQFKPKAGQVVTYETGLAHQVRPVTKGERKALIWWTHSLILNMTDLYAWRTLKILALKGEGAYPRDIEDVTDDLYEFVRKPHCIYYQAANNIIRKHLYTMTNAPLI